MKNRKMFAEKKSTEEINMSPLIDMVFILLIFFIVTTVFVEETGVEVNKPQAASASDLEKNSILIAITENGNVVYGGKEVGISGVRPIIRRLYQKEKMPVIIQADRQSITDTLVRVIDEAKLAGAISVSLSTED
ncbi:ExbD/TolR family protein [Pelagicoccus albus]|uniref:Biopolymer transporter ExbD n=1 Tax=Pelagicoccus albus TaxID=415222 RepID=A0A7X1B7D1_9BACT|nr:biopolymer transporter ExbD [Pelagicoccus albus]MBC2607015.1 biopolymer transporter ExbD [Pelagicoccus albus]